MGDEGRPQKTGNKRREDTLDYFAKWAKVLIDHAAENGVILTVKDAHEVGVHTANIIRRWEKWGLK